MAKYLGDVTFKGTGYTTITDTPTALALHDTDDFTQIGEMDQLDSVDSNTFEFSVGAYYRIHLNWVTDNVAFTPTSFHVNLYNVTGAAAVEELDFPLTDSIYGAGGYDFYLLAVTGSDYELRVSVASDTADVKFDVAFSRLD